MGHGRALINIDDNKLQMKIYEIIIKKNLSVRNTERLINDLKKENLHLTMMINIQKKSQVR